MMKLIIALVVLCILAGCISENAGPGGDVKENDPVKEKVKKVVRRKISPAKVVFPGCDFVGYFLVCPSEEEKKAYYSVIIEVGVNDKQSSDKVCLDETILGYLRSQLPELSCKLNETKIIKPSDPDLNYCLNGLSSLGCHSCAYSCT
ncbi:hypothetical protein ACFLRF_04100 [Candidatus Altiarchaeota archaeon]